MQVQILDHGYVEFVEAWGTGKDGVGDERAPLFLEKSDYEVGIVEAARQSTQGSFRGWEGDSKLLTRLYDNRHGTPFEFSGMTIEIQLPLFVRSEWHRHRTQSYNEMSARYAILPDLYYLPRVERMLIDGGANKQAQGTGAKLTGDKALDNQRKIRAFYRMAEELYQAALTDGLPKEVARCVMPVGHYTRMRATGNLRNWLAFMTLRSDPLAQWEIRQYAAVVGSIIETNFPKTHSLWKVEPRVRCAKLHVPILHPEGECPLCYSLGTGVEIP